MKDVERPSMLLAKGQVSTLCELLRNSSDFAEAARLIMLKKRKG